MTAMKHMPRPTNLWLPVEGCKGSYRQGYRL